jgi:hypothetical protein
MLHQTLPMRRRPDTIVVLIGQSGGGGDDRNRPVFRRPHNGSTLSDEAMAQPDAWCMIRRRLAVIGTV